MDPYYGSGKDETSSEPQEVTLTIGVEMESVLQAILKELQHISSVQDAIIQNDNEKMFKEGKR